MSTSDEPPDDPFEALHLDDERAHGAAIREPSARSRSLQADLVHRDAEQAKVLERRRREVRRHRCRRRGAAILGLTAFAAAVALADRHGGSAATTWTSSDRDGEVLTLSDRPPAKPATSAQPLGTPADPDADGGRFAFLQTQPDGSDPVTYDPCRPITIVVNDRTAPPGGAELVEEAVATISEVSGLALRISEETDEAPRIGRPSYQPHQYGRNWAPVLVAWTDEDEISDLGGDVAGLGGSVAVEPESGPKTYVTGVVYLDGPDIGAIIRDEDDGERSARDIVLHELGHLVGLAHVDDPSELMYPEGQPDLHNLQQGDKTGLTRLGQGACVARL